MKTTIKVFGITLFSKETTDDQSISVKEIEKQVVTALLKGINTTIPLTKEKAFVSSEDLKNL